MERHGGPCCEDDVVEPEGGEGGIQRNDQVHVQHLQATGIRRACSGME